MGIACTAVLTTGCGWGLHESARTLAPGQVSSGGAITLVANERADDGKLRVATVVPDVVPVRVGVARRVDVGVGLFYFVGLRADVKVSLLPPTSIFALAVRGGAGGAVFPEKLVTAFAGVLASVDLGDVLQPYLGVTYATHWIFGLNTEAPTNPGERLAARAGYGDGLLQSALGMRFFVDGGGKTRASVSLEYGLWVPLHDDPGDGFAFVLSHLGSLGFCIGCPGPSRRTGKPARE